jgi:hypothetical protein
MTFTPIPELNAFICEIAVSGVSSITDLTGKTIGLSAITYDTGSQIQLLSDIITIPANCDIYIKANISIYGRNAANGAFLIKFVDADTNIDIVEQSQGLSFLRPAGTTSSVWMAGLEAYMIKLNSASSQRIKVVAASGNSQTGDVLAPDSANLYRPNPTVFIMYTGS